LQRGGEEGRNSCREEQMEGSHAKRRRREREVMQRGAEGRESCREEKKSGEVMQRGAEGR
jgi:hypothetical protein